MSAKHLAQPSFLRSALALALMSLALSAAAQQTPKAGAVQKITPAGPPTPPLVESQRVREIREQAAQLSNLRQQQALIDAQVGVAKAQAELAKARAETIKAERDPLTPAATGAAPGAVPAPGMNNALPAPGQPGATSGTLSTVDPNKITLVGTQGRPGYLTASIRQGDTITTVGVGDDFNGWKVDGVSLMEVRLVKTLRGKVSQSRVLRVENPIEKSTNTNTAAGSNNNLQGGYPGQPMPMQGGY